VSGLGRIFGGRRRGRDTLFDEPEEQVAATELPRSDAETSEDERLARLGSRPLWTDSHCHLQHLDTDDELAAVVDRALESGTRRMIVVGTDAPSSRRAVDIALNAGRDGALPVELWATVGLHPHDSTLGTADVRNVLEEMSGRGLFGSQVVGVGECGLDFHYDHSPWPVQRRAFAEQVRMAHEFGLALVIHTREAWEDTFAILSDEGVPPRTMFHCFTGGPREAERCLALGAYLSYGGIVTFANADDLREAVLVTPLDRLLVETDSPFLTPVPYRGKTNEPCFVPVVGEAIAALKRVDPEEVAKATSANASVVFDLH
jgi:TatD DNase family protein